MAIMTGSKPVFTGTISSRVVMPSGDINVSGTYSGKAFQQIVPRPKRPSVVFFDPDTMNFHVVDLDMVLGPNVQVVAVMT